MLKPANHLSKSPAAAISQIDFKQGQKLCHIYMEAQVFSPDSKHFIVHSGADPHGALKDEEHIYYRCDIGDGFSLAPLTTRNEATAPAISPDGKYFYYILDTNWLPGPGHDAELRRCNLDGAGDMLVCHIPACLPGTKLQLWKFYPLSTISSDGGRLAVQAALFSPRTQMWTWALLVFDLAKGGFHIPFANVEYPNSHPQYSRSLDPLESHDLMIQQNHGHLKDGDYTKGVGTQSCGADIHVISDDGSNFRDLPFGRSPREMELGHQCWRGRGNWIIGQCLQWDEPCCIDGIPCPSQNKAKPIGAFLFASKPIRRCDHLGVHTPGSSRLELCNYRPSRFFGHFATDMAGDFLIVDGMSQIEQLSELYLIRLGDFDKGEVPAEKDWTFLADTKTSNQTHTYGTEHCHPFLSPDSKYGFFNSNESGILRPYVIDLTKLTGK